MEILSIHSSFASIVRVLALASLPAIAVAQAVEDVELQQVVRDAAARNSYDVVQLIAHGAPAGDAVWTADNPAQRLRATFGRDGAAIEALRAGGPGPRLELALAAWGRPSALESATVPHVATMGAWIELERGALVEWFYNGVEGIEHGFTLSAPPGGNAESGLELRLSIGGTTAFDSQARDALTFRDECGANVLSYSGLRAWDATGRALDAHMLAVGEELSILVDDSGAAYPVTIDPVVAALDAKLLPIYGFTHFALGSEVAVSGDTAVALTLGQSVGVMAYVFVRSTSGWAQQARLEAVSYNAWGFGDVSIDGNILAFGNGPYTNDYAGFDVYERTGTIWSSTYNRLTVNIQVAMGLGISVSGDRVAVTDDFPPYSSTSIHVRTPSWHIEQVFGPGGSVALRNDVFVMSTNWWPNSQVRVYQRTVSTWNLLATPMSFTGFGTKPVAIDGEHTIAIGDPGDDQVGTDAGAVYLLRQVGSTWVQWDKLLSPNYPNTAGFGGRIAFDDGTLAVGVDGDDTAATDAGAVYLYRRNGGWTLEQTLTAFDAATGDRFGCDVSLSGDRLLVGAHDDDDQGSNTGSTYVFTLSSDAKVYCAAKVNSLGCLPRIDFTGAPSATSAAPFAITARQVLNQRIGLAYYGTSGRAAIPFQGGTRCVAPPTKRLPAQMSGGNLAGSDCSGTYSYDFNALVQSGADPNLVPGVRVDLQFWCRDPLSPSATGLSDAIEFVIGP